ncbi:MAG: GTP cyclohydrolase FolE2 [Lysobacteraceae bacterium]
MLQVTDTEPRALPDVAVQVRPDAAGALDWVGMSGIEMAVRVADGEGGDQRCPARVGAYVSLDRPEARGIHMSRLYLHLDRLLGEAPLSAALLRRLLDEFLASHQGLSQRAMVSLRYEHLLRRPALRSDNSGWRAYPVRLRASLERNAGGEETFDLELGLDITYSSTCPCSAALARRLVQDRFDEGFAGGSPDHDAIRTWLGSEQGIIATPHSQRSVAELRLRPAPSLHALPVERLIDRVEAALGTPVQTAVKREDEQAFALNNGQNLMFCEDAARRIRAALDVLPEVADFWLRVAHLESLHPHDAVAVASKGVAGGYRIGPGDFPP